MYTADMLLDQLSLLSAGGALFLGLLFIFQLSRGLRPGAWRELALLIGVCALNAAHPGLTRLFGLSVTASGQFFEPIEFLLPPLLWVYSQAAVRGRFAWRMRDSLHFVPFLAAVAVSAWFAAGGRMPVVASVVFWAALCVQMAVYLGPALRAFHIYQRGLADRVSNWAVADLGWLRWFYWVAAGLCVLAFAVPILLLHDLTPTVLGLGVSIAFTGAVWVLGTRGLEQKAPPTQDPPETSSPERTPLPESEARRIKASLEKLFETERPHLDPDLDLATLASLVGLPRNHLSYVINSQFGVNFYDLVNGWRLGEFQALASDPARQEDKILTLAFDSGFNSKPTFNKVVLKLTGKTPSQVRRLVVESSRWDRRDP